MTTDHNTRPAAPTLAHTVRTALALLTLIGVAAFVAACGATGSALPTGAPPTPTVFRILVTRAPLPTATPEPTVALPYDIGGVVGAWVLDLRFTLLDNPVFSRIQYIGAAALDVDGRGNVTGSAEFYANVSPSASQVGCTTSVLDSAPITARIEGALQPGEHGGALGDLTLLPDDPLALTSLWLFCPDFAEPYQAAEPMFWPALRAAGMLHLTLPVEAGARLSSAADVSGPGGGGLHGLLQADIRLSR
ncbi:MAG: hypothetical protein IT323_17945 [Anaerolineae bacterium]|nr:hypothetical protein [Anaerolineae bacterium]